ncbi:uncharacterized protein LAJ45_06631 [Morchella importuna]|uniref:uncharacterized protein n=1 Tax=Morchella importuna TaxID=1174673 RepID=UPI001E8D3699|nr:uncharacterized protein LAJ45_06631 [Morchella importuna]KAH8149092.1 hypothetical protein LAJ45_06631 [Morchella importuna]
MGCCSSTEYDQYAAQSRRLATNPAVVNTTNYPYRNPVQTASRQRPKAKPKTNPRPRSSIPGSVITSVNELNWPALEPLPERPDTQRGRPTRFLSVLSVNPREELGEIPETATPVLPPDGIYYEGYAPPLPDRVPQDPHPDRMAREPPPIPPKEKEAVLAGDEHGIAYAPAVPPKPDQIRGEAIPAPLAKDLHSVFAELSSQRRVAELAGPPPPAELDDTLVPNPVHEEVRMQYRDAVPYAPNFSELPAQVLPVSPSGPLYSPHLVGSEMNQGLQPRIASPRHADSIHKEMDAAGATYELDYRQRSPHRQVVESLIPSSVPATDPHSRYVRQRTGSRR